MTKTFFRASKFVLGASAASSLLFATHAANAAQVVLGPATPRSIFHVECAGCEVTMKFQIFNTGSPDLSNIVIDSVEGVAAPISGDTTYDVAAFKTTNLITSLEDTPNGGTCSIILQYARNCFLTATFLILDGDPLDTFNPTPDSGLWKVGVKVNWRLPSATTTQMLESYGRIRVTDLPEPGSWALMVLGFGGAGAALRHRRRRVETVS